MANIPGCGERYSEWYRERCNQIITARRIYKNPENKVSLLEKCSHCGALCSELSHRNAYNYILSGSYQYHAAGVCFKCMRYYERMFRHVEQKKCGVCGKYFAVKSDGRQHLFKIHNRRASLYRHTDGYDIWDIYVFYDNLIYHTCKSEHCRKIRNAEYEVRVTENYLKYYKKEISSWVRQQKLQPSKELRAA